MTEPLLSVRGLVKHFPLTQGILFKRTVRSSTTRNGSSLVVGSVAWPASRCEAGSLVWVMTGAPSGRSRCTGCRPQYSQ